MTTDTQKLRANIAYNTDNYSLDCNIPGVPALEIGANRTVDSIVLNASGVLEFFIMRGNHTVEYFPSEHDCRTALNWINANFDKIFPED